MPTREEARQAFRGVVSLKQDTPPWTECVNIVQAYLKPEPESPDAELFSEIHQLIRRLDESTDGAHSIYTNGDGLWGLSGEFRCVANLELDEIRDHLRLLLGERK